MTTNSFIFQSAKRLLEKELQKCSEALKMNEHKWNEYMDLKLHKINYGVDCDFELNGANIHFNEDYLNDEFYQFCDMEFESFSEWCAEELKSYKDFDDIRDRVGTTSSFYLGTLHNHYADRLTVALAEAVDDFNMSNLGFTDRDDKIVITTDFDNMTKEELEDYVNEMLALAETLYDNLMYKLNDIIMVYDYIRDFKEGQVEAFKDFVQEGWKNNIV